MGQKVHPYGIRLGIIRPWLSRWYAEDNRYRDQIIEDVKVRRLIREGSDGTANRSLTFRDRGNRYRPSYDCEKCLRCMQDEGVAGRG